MFSQNSRYAGLATYQAIRADGTSVTVIRLPIPVQRPLAGYFARKKNQRLDLIAAHFLADATAFWQLCDANKALSPDALAVHNQVGIPQKA
jgi:hypothetical protein